MSNTTDNQIFALPQGLGGVAAVPLVTAINDRLRRINTALNSATAPVAAPPVLYGTHAERVNRPVAADRTIYVETDRNGVEYQARGSGWVYVSGVMQGAWVTMPADLGKPDTGFVFFDSVDSLHIWQWTGTAWTWGPGDRHSGEFGQFDADPGTGWHLCDGSVNQTKYAADGTRVATFTVPDQRGFFLKAGATYTGSGVAAVAPTLTMNSYTPAGTVTEGAITTTGGSFIKTVTGTGVTSTSGSAIVNVSGGGGTDPLVGTPAVLTGTISNTGTPPAFAVLPYYRL